MEKLPASIDLHQKNNKEFARQIYHEVIKYADALEDATGKNISEAEAALNLMDLEHPSHKEGIVEMLTDATKRNIVRIINKMEIPSQFNRMQVYAFVMSTGIRFTLNRD